MMGDGEGQTGDPSLFSTWLAHGPATCVSYSPDAAGHGTLLTRGWPLGGGRALIDLDTFNGTWKFNDFTFGTRKCPHRRWLLRIPFCGSAQTRRR